MAKSEKNFNLAIVALVIAVIYFIKAGHGFLNDSQKQVQQSTINSVQISNLAQNNAQLLAAHRAHAKSILVTGQAIVKRTLVDDNKGERHQRFILEVGDGVTVLVAHNIDISHKIVGLKAGDIVSYQGEYIYNNKGGVLHWTHHDPRSSHSGGWLTVDGIRYQ